MKTYEYNPICYNEVIWHMEKNWERKLTDHEKHILIEGYKFGRFAEMRNTENCLYKEEN